jgi:hypothetical protein
MSPLSASRMQREDCRYLHEIIYTAGSKHHVSIHVQLSLSHSQGAAAGPSASVLQARPCPRLPGAPISDATPAGTQHTAAPSVSAQSMNEPLITPCRSLQPRLLSICPALASPSSICSQLASCPGQRRSSQQLGRTQQHPLRLDTPAAQLQAFTMLHNRVPMLRSCKRATWQQLRLRGHMQRQPVAARRRWDFHSSNKCRHSISKCCHSSPSLPSSTLRSSWQHSSRGRRRSSTTQRPHSRSSSMLPL